MSSIENLGYMASHLSNLPSEILSLIVEALDEAPPSERYVYDEPKPGFFNSVNQPLKNLSLCSARFRDATAATLFHHVRVSSNHDVQELLHTLQRYHIVHRTPPTLLWHFSGTEKAESSHETPQPSQEAVRHYVHVLRPSCVTLALHHSVMATVLDRHVQRGDEWAFSMPFHVLRLEDISPTSYPLALKELSEDTESQSSPTARASSTRNACLSVELPCRSVIYNEGSSVSAYSTYEYYHLQTPSLAGRGFDAWSARRKSLFSSLVTFTFIAVFPFGRLDGFAEMVCSSPVQTLRLQLAPRAQRRSMESGTASAVLNLGRADAKDLWAEYESNYFIFACQIAHDIHSQVNRFESLDYVNEDIRSIVDHCCGEMMKNGWTQPNPEQGIWVKDSANISTESDS